MKLETEVIRDGDKVIVKFGLSEPSQKTISKWQKLLGCSLSFCARRPGQLILWNGPSNVRVAGLAKTPKRLRLALGFNWVDTTGHSRMPEIAKHLQSRYSKIRYARKWSHPLYEGLIRPRANGLTVAAFDAPTLP